MALAQTDRSLPSPIEDALGRMREYVVALHNTDRLLRARSIGPKVLGGLLPEISELLPRLRESSALLADFVSSELGTDFSSLTNLVEGGASTVEKEIRATDDSPLSAKSRLRLERVLDEYLDVLSAALQHTDLMVESTWAEGVSVSFGELLLSQPPLPENSKSRSITIFGSPENAEIKLPARVAARALSLLVVEFETPLFRLVSSKDGHVLSALPRSTPDTSERRETFPLPSLRTLPVSRAACFAVLARYGVACDFASGRLVFPLPG